MSRRETSQEIDDAAADWAARIDRGLSPLEQAAFEAWAATDVRRRGAVARMLAVMAHVGPAPCVLTPLRVANRAVHPRRWFLGGALAASVGLASFGAGELWAGQRFETAKGARRTVTLADGTVLRLDTDTAVRVTYRRGRRDVALLRGQALFDVAKDPSRPFVVRAGPLSVQAVGTRFAVSRLTRRPLQVQLVEGRVDVRAGAGAAHRLAPGDQVLAPRQGPLEVRRVGLPAMMRELAWRDGLLDLDGVSLGEAAAILDRYSDIRIVFDDPAIARLTVSGRFACADPAGFARAAALSLNLQAREQDGAIHLRR